MRAGIAVGAVAAALLVVPAAQAEDRIGIVSGDSPPTYFDGGGVGAAANAVVTTVCFPIATYDFVEPDPAPNRACYVYNDYNGSWTDAVSLDGVVGVTTSEHASGHAGSFTTLDLKLGSAAKPFR